MRIEKFQFRTFEEIERDSAFVSMSLTDVFKDENSAISDEEMQPEPENKVSEEDVNNAFQEGYSKGLKEGRESLQAEIEAKQQIDSQILSGLVENIQKDLSVVSDSIINLAENSVKSAIEVATNVAMKLAKKAISENQFKAMEDSLQSVLATLFLEPSITIYVSSNAKESVKKCIADVAQVSRYRGEIVIEADSAMNDGDFRVEWKDGFAERDVESIITKVLDNMKFGD